MTSVTSLAYTHERRRLTVVTAIVVAVHALLILGLPRWGSAGTPGLGHATLVTRMIAAGPQATEQPAAAPAPQPEPEPEPALPEPPAPPTPPEPPQPPTAPDASAAAALPKPARPRPASRPRASANTSSSTAPSTSTATSGATAAGTGQDSEMSLLTQPAPPQFAPYPPAAPIEVRPTEADSQAMRASIKSDNDAPVLPPHSARITYRVSGHIGALAIDVPSTLNWRHDGQHYRADWVFYHVKAGERSRYADGLITPQGLAPINTWQRTERKRDMLFDYAGQLLRFSDDTPELPLPPGTQDTLSALLQLSALINADPKRYPPGTSISLPVAPNGQPAADWRVVVEDEETIEGLGGRPLNTLRLKHHARQDGDAQIELWLAAALEHLPARLRVTESNGDVLDYQVRQAYGVQVLPPPPSGPTLVPLPLPAPAQ